MEWKKRGEKGKNGNQSRHLDILLDRVFLLAGAYRQRTEHTRVYHGSLLQLVCSLDRKKLEERRYCQMNVQ